MIRRPPKAPRTATLCPSTTRIRSVGALDQLRVGGMVKAAIADRLRDLDVAPLLGQALQAALAEGRHQPLLDAMVQWGSKTLDLNDHLIHQMFQDRKTTRLNSSH